MTEQKEGVVNPELAELVGKNVIIKETKDTLGRGAGHHGRIESIFDGKLRVFITVEGRTAGGPYDMEREEVEIEE